MRARGYGADLEYDGGEFVTIYPGKVSAKIAGADVIRVPVADVERVEFKPASALVNGQVRLHVRDASTERLWSYGDRQPNRVNRESLVVTFRKRDREAFEALRAELEQQVPSA
ncbi:DUF4429 domain-containing protein [Antribacter gilvus]|uniref:DUF4429 domain-containing protein n=1 Tax=Antribacter gilvus TaxID=2304675 RepID=UPI000F7AA11B|nr:DUF4429 domain-containing protein [Antribacter gilvus]